MEELLRAQGKDAKAVVFGTPSLEARWITQTFGIAMPPDGSANLANAASVMIVDVSDPRELAEELPPTLITEIIDHRTVVYTNDFANAKAIQIELVGSCGTLVAERFAHPNIQPSKDAARLLVGAIVSNTVNFRSPGTTDRDRSMADWLKPFADLPDTFVRDMFIAKSDLRGDELRKALVGDYITKDFGGKRIGIFQLEVVDVDKVMAGRREEIDKVVQEENGREKFDYLFLNGLDTLAGTCTLIAFDDASRALAEQALGRTFVGDRSTVGHIVMCKQITPKLQAYLER
jgi:manganese-dependent inorganic pyrophosphatase